MAQRKQGAWGFCRQESKLYRTAEVMVLRMGTALTSYVHALLCLPLFMPRRNLLSLYPSFC